MAQVVREDVQRPTHMSEVKCKECGCPSRLVMIDGEFVCRERHYGPLQMRQDSPYSRNARPRFR